MPQNAGFNFYTNIPPERVQRRPMGSARRSMPRSAAARASRPMASRPRASRPAKEGDAGIRKNFAETFLWQDVKVYK